MVLSDTDLENWEEGDEPGREETLIVGPAEAGQRLDRLAAARLPDISRAYLQTLIADGRVLVGERPRKASHRLQVGDRITIAIPPPTPAALRAEAIPLAVVYEDGDLLVVDKPAGMVVHPAPGHATGTVANAVLAYMPEVRLNGSIRPGIVHRLDKDTSGLLAIAKHERAFAALAAQFQERRTLKVYRALLDGVVAPDAGTVDAPIARDPRNRQRMAVLRGGRDALTHFTVRERFAHHTLVDVRIETGRTHQIRVHCAFIGHPVTGDSVYGRGAQATRELGLRRQFLHAARLGLVLPGGSWHEFVSPLPHDLATVLARLQSQASGPAATTI